jgi:quinol monooxygenase YgiN
MYARYTTVRGDPSRIDAALQRVDGQVRDSVEATQGNRGFAVLADAEGGRIVGASYWDSAESLRASEPVLADSRAAAARPSTGTRAWSASRCWSDFGSPSRPEARR